MCLYKVQAIGCLTSMLNLVLCVIHPFASYEPVHRHRFLHLFSLVLHSMSLCLNILYYLLYNISSCADPDDSRQTWSSGGKNAENLVQWIWFDLVMLRTYFNNLIIIWKIEIKPKKNMQSNDVSSHEYWIFSRASEFTLEMWLLTRSTFSYRCTAHCQTWLT